ncbi:metal-dependent hydrolase [Pseudomonas sp. NW5]|uniref:metal-dependent hydrolase n=1 Tax=Pseudomonas sp. NW5 TaxID=2934934 RepID=UPI00202025FA|nr:metal-dependent hydrolase [Pseudomonas sp. NW5]
MDSLTQALLGASVQGALLGRWQGRKALLYGALLGTLPDLDVLLDYADPVANMTCHRGFSHSLLVLGALGLILTWLIRRWRPHPSYSAQRLWLTLTLVLVTHALLDAFTSYGTQLLWPLDTPPIAWSSLFIIDPLYTLPLLLAVLLGLLARQTLARASRVALLASTVYLGFSLLAQQLALQRVSDTLAERGIRPEALFIAPTPFNTLLWRVVALEGEHYHELVTGLFDHQPPQSERFERGQALAAALQDSTQHARLVWFSGGFLRYDALGDQLVVTDLRLGMTGLHPFRFVLAKQRAGAWQILPTSQRWPAERGGRPQLMALRDRLLNPDSTLPLAQWATLLKAIPAPIGTPQQLAERGTARNDDAASVTTLSESD